MQVSIVPITSEEEAKGKAYVHCMAWKEAYRGLLSQEFLTARTLEFSEERALNAFRTGVGTLLAKDGDEVIGFADYDSCRDEGMEEAGEVYAIYLLSAYYGKGIGARLMDAALHGMSDSDRVVVWVLKGNERAIRFYEAFGFRFDGASKVLDLGGEATVLRMVLQRKRDNKNSFSCRKGRECVAMTFAGRQQELQRIAQPLERMTNHSEPPQPRPPD